jgi:hypothetical protein
MSFVTGISSKNRSIVAAAPVARRFTSIRATHRASDPPLLISVRRSVAVIG